MTPLAEKAARFPEQICAAEPLSDGLPSVEAGIPTRPIDRDAIPTPIVVAAPRTGFSLLTHVINAIFASHGVQPSRGRRDTLLRAIIDVGSLWQTRRLRTALATVVSPRDVIFNGEFHLLVGGPKWLDPQDPTRARIRKYIGVRGLGDVLLVTALPREAFEYHSVVHSHTAPALWPRLSCYAASPRFTSIRNPIGVINSACFSLNAMASEYIQHYLPFDHESVLRQRLALYKLTDVTFVRGLVTFLTKYLDEYLPVRDHYATMRWEDLITAPIATIQTIADQLGMPVSSTVARAIWDPMDHVNLLEFHQHNYRRGKGIVGDWKSSLVNEHMALFREAGFDRYLAELGYPPIGDLDPRDYSPYQRLASRYLQRGEVYRNTGDPDLFGFAFNKTNIDASAFGFKSRPPRQWTWVERSTIADERVVDVVSDVAEETCAAANALMAEVIAAAVDNDAAWSALVSSIEKQSRAWAEELSDAEALECHGRAFASVRAAHKRNSR